MSVYVRIQSECLGITVIGRGGRAKKGDKQESWTRNIKGSEKTEKAWSKCVNILKQRNVWYREG